MARQTIAVSILAEASGVRKGVEQANGHLGRLEGKASKLGRVLKGALVGTAAVAGFKSIVASASSAQQSIGATEQIYGKYASQVIRKSEQAATAVGLSANEYRELSNVSGAMLKSSGMPLAKVATLTDKLNVRAADLAATFGGTTKDAVAAVGSLLRGEADPIEKYGISIKQSDVNAQLAAQGLGKLTGAARKQAEQQARLTLLFDQSKDSAGQFARETNTLGGQQQRLGAQFENIKATVGAQLLPALTTLLAYVGTNLPGAFAAVKREAAGFAAAAAPIASTLKDAFVSALPAIQSVGAFLLDHKGTVLALVAAFAGFKVVIATVRTYKAAVLGIKAAQQAYAMATYGMAASNGSLLTSLASTAGALKVKSAAVLTSMTSTGKAIAMDLRWQLMLARQKVQVIATAVAQRSVALATGAWSAAQWALNAAMTANPIGLILVGLVALGAALVIAYQKSETFRAIVKAAFSAVGAAAKSLWSGVQAAFNGLKAAVRVAGQAVRTYLLPITTAFKLVISGAKAVLPGVKGAFNSVISFVRGIPGKAKSALGNVRGILVSAGKDLIMGFVDGISGAFGAVKGKLGSLTSKLTSWKGPPKRDAKILTPAGALIIDGLIRGIESREGALRGTLGRITRDIAATSVPSLAFEDGPLLDAFKRPALSPGAVRAGASGAPGGTTYQITVNVPVGASSAETGRELVKHIKAYERAGGTVK